VRATWSAEGATWTLNLVQDAEDPVFGDGQGKTTGGGKMQVGLLARECHVELPRAISEPHPDLEALAALVICRPWIARRLHLRRGVSEPFAAMAKKLFQIDTGPVDNGLTPRTPGNAPLLSFSGGADSIAVSEMLPSGTPHIHLRRTPHPRVPNRVTQVRADAVERVAAEVGRRGRNVSIVRSDLEYLCHPWATLPHWFAIAIGPLLLADELDGGAIGLGGTFDTFYMDFGRRWTGPGGSGMGPLCDLVGLPLLRPALVLSEIGTMSLTLQSDVADIARSCVFGDVKKPCYECAKCVRKELMTAALRGNGKLPPSLARLSESAPGWKQLSGDPPYYMQAQLEFALARLDARGSILADLKGRLKPDPVETEWMLRYYRPALVDGIPTPWRSYIAEQVSTRLGFMTDADVAAAQAWSR